MTGVDVEHTKARISNLRTESDVCKVHGITPGPSAMESAISIAEGLVAAVERVQALHATPECGCEEFRVGKSCPHDKVCTGCALYWPCPTIRALETR